MSVAARRALTVPPMDIGVMVPDFVVLLRQLHRVGRSRAPGCVAASQIQAKPCRKSARTM